MGKSLTFCILVFLSLSIDGGCGGCDVSIVVVVVVVVIVIIVVVVVGRLIRSNSENIYIYIYIYVFYSLTWQTLFHRSKWAYNAMFRSSGILRRVKWKTVTGNLEKCFDSTFLIKHSKRVLYSGWTL